MQVTVIGRGHSGTRTIANTLKQSGVYMGPRVSGAGDLIPGRLMYMACRMVAKHVKPLGHTEWDFSKLHEMPIPIEFQRVIRDYLSHMYEHDEPCGWKLPETLLVFPWIVRMFPDIHYIYLIRDPRDCILKQILSDTLGFSAIPWISGFADGVREVRAICWKYYSEIFKQTPPPKNLLKVRFEDFVLDQDTTLKRMEEFLGMPMTKIPVRKEPVGRWKADTDKHDFPWFAPELAEYGYQPLDTR